MPFFLITWWRHMYTQTAFTWRHHARGFLDSAEHWGPCDDVTLLVYQLMSLFEYRCYYCTTDMSFACLCYWFTPNIKILCLFVTDILFPVKCKCISYWLMFHSLILLLSCRCICQQWQVACSLVCCCCTAWLQSFGRETWGDISDRW